MQKGYSLDKSKRITHATFYRDQRRKKKIKTAKTVIYITALGAALMTAYSTKQSEANDKPKTTIIYTDTLTGGTFDNTISLSQVKKTPTEKICEEAQKKVGEYSYVYNLDANVLYDAVEKRILAHTDEQLEKSNNIFNPDEKYPSLDMQIILIAKELINNPALYDYDSKDIYAKKVDRPNITIKEMVKKYADAFGLDNELMLAIACAESGNFEQPIATQNNNPYSCRSTGPFFVYDSLERGILEGQLNLKKNYFDKGLNNLSAIATVYCPDTPNQWTTIVSKMYYEVKAGKTLYDEKDKKLSLK